MGPRARGAARAGAAAAAVLALDQATKALARASLEPGESVNVFFGIDLTLVRNTGIAFGALSDAGGAVIAALTGFALLAMLAWFATRPATPHLWLPVGAVVGGAVGNLVDRARQGAVTDFVDPAFWPAFNLADTAIVLGVLGVLYVAEGPRDERPRERSGAGEDAAGAAGGAGEASAGARPAAGCDRSS